MSANEKQYIDANSKESLQNKSRRKQKYDKLEYIRLRLKNDFTDESCLN